MERFLRSSSSISGQEVDDEDEEETAETMATDGIAKASKNWNVFSTLEERLYSDADGSEARNRRFKKYENVDQYLETQFRVTKEIVLGPLRQGLKKFRDPYFRTDPDIKVYDDCTVTHWDDKKLTLKIDRTKNRENIKIPDVGNTVCLSHDDFKTFLIGTVNYKHPKQICVQYYKEIDFFLSKDYGYCVITCGINFEEHLLRLTALKSLSASTFPLKEYLIDLKKIAEPLEYFRCGLSTWSSLDTVGFDFSQFETLKAVLNSKFSVVQGAAGTGKTMLGRQIVRIFLENLQLWYHRSPILVVAPSKTTLDVFVQGLDKLTEKIVRLTDDSKFQNQERFSLESHRQIRRSKGQIVAENIKKNLLRRLSMIEEAIENAFENTRRICDGVLNFRFFANLDPRFEKSWFTETPQEQLVEWLLDENCGGKFQNVKGETKNSDDLSSTTPLENNSKATEQDAIEKEILQLEKYVQQTIKPSSSLIFSVSAVSNEIKELKNTLYGKSSKNNLSKNNFIRNKKKLHGLTSQLCYVRKRLQESVNYWPILEDTTKINVENPRNVVPDDRWSLYRNWLHLFEKHLEKCLERLRGIRNRVQNSHSSYGGLGDVPIMKDALVIASTVDALKWHYKNLQRVGCRVAIFDDAEHIPELQIVVGLTDRCRQLIVLGNRQNLTEDDLRKNLFGRAILDGSPNYILELQHRMCPEIYEAVFFSSTFPEHRFVTQQRVYGLTNSIFFLDHLYPETETKEKSRVNEHEVLLLSRLAYRLMLNGYAAKDVTILTPYNAQAFAFCKELNRLSHRLSQVPIKTLENFRGCESKIVLLSLVRSNRKRDVGILGTQDIAWLALSRAREGLIIMGNAKLMGNCGVDLWTRFVYNMRIQNKLAPYLTLKCEYHKVTFEVKHYQDLDERAPEGGCSKNCNTKLVCGHICTRTCHLLDQEHKNERSCTQCDKLVRIFYSKEHSLEDTRVCGHPRLPGEDKHKCLIMVKEKLPCGHEVLDKPCWEDSKTYKCPRMCQTKLPNCDHVCMRRCHFQDDRYHKSYRCYETCGKINVSCSTKEHRCERKCDQNCLKCEVIVEKKKPDCEHFVKIECHKNPSKNENCEQPCQRKLFCGHTCRRKCFEKCGGCAELVQKTLAKCGHAIQTKCSEKFDSSLCNGACVLKLPCGHSCKNACNDPCTSQCQEIVKNVTMSCGHVLSETRCYLIKNVSKSNHKKVVVSNYRCYETCGRINVSCSTKEHRCERKCYQNCLKCEVIVEKKKPDCEHFVKIECHKNPSKNENCEQPCQRKLSCGHTCRRKCFEKCGGCAELVQKTLAKCGHAIQTKCSEKFDSSLCNGACVLKLPCGHSCKNACNDPCTSQCQEIVKNVTMSCGHVLSETRCYRIKNVSKSNHKKVVVSNYKCYEMCGIINVSCSTKEHRCDRKYGQNCLKCEILVEKKMPDCEHFVKIECHKSTSNNVNCEQSCQRRLSCGHDCRRKCFEECGGCEELVQKTLAKCGHAVQTKCSEKADSSLCKGACVLKLPCGHNCKNACNDPCTSQCHEIIKNVTLSCGHVLSETRCYLIKNDTELLSLCTRSCLKILRCGHMCSGTCGSCLRGRIHRLCTQKCSIPLICGHNCPLRCSELCVACESPCPLKCPHQRCQNLCGYRCTPCQKTCPRQCQHVRCTKPCSEICDVEPCNKACPVVLPCRHLCAGFCGDPCPPLCKQCHAVKLGLEKDSKSAANARFVLLEECGHVINHRVMEESVLARGQLIRHVSCPECGTVVTCTQRYRNKAKTVLLDIVSLNGQMINEFSTSSKLKESVLEKLHNFSELGNKFFLTDHLRQVLHTCLLQIWQSFDKPPIKYYRLGNALRAKLTIFEHILLALSPLKFDRQLDTRISKYAETLLTQLVKDVAYVTEQQVSDYFYELKRLSYLVNYNQLCCVEERFPEKSFTALDSLLEKMAEVIFVPTIFDEFVEIQAKIKLQESIDTVAKIIGVKLRLSEHRKPELPVAIGSRLGAWCKCPKGHYYTIFSMEYGQGCELC